MAFERTFQVAWGHLDAIGHMANTAYLDLAVDARFLYFESRGFPPQEFTRAGIGPVVRRDEVDYFRELRLLQPVRVNLLLAGLSDDASRFRLVNEFRRDDGELCARLTSQGGWLDLKARKLVAPPEKLAQALFDLARTETFSALDSSVKR
jgi:acyl-CoA thioester hydrolase